MKLREARVDEIKVESSDGVEEPGFFETFLGHVVNGAKLFARDYERGGNTPEYQRERYEEWMNRPARRNWKPTPEDIALMEKINRQLPKPKIKKQK